MDTKNMQKPVKENKHPQVLTKKKSNILKGAVLRHSTMHEKPGMEKTKDIR